VSLVPRLERMLFYAGIVSDDFARCAEYHDRRALEQLIADARVALLAMALADVGTPASMSSNTNPM